MAKSENNVVSGTANGTTVVVEAGQNILVDVTSPDLVVFSQDGSDLIITSIADGSKIELEGFFSQAASELPPQLTLSDGSVITAADVTGLVEAFDPGAVAPAAGGAGGAGGGGASFDAYADDGIGEGIGIDGLLDPTDLGFPADAPIEFLVALPGQPQFLLNEIGLGTDLFGGGEEKRESVSDLEQQMGELGNAAVDAFLEAASGEHVDFLELRNNTNSDQSTGGNGPSTVGEGVTTVSIIGPDGEPASFDLPSLTVPSGGHLLILQVETGDEEATEFETLYLVFDADGTITQSGPLNGADDWPMGGDTTEPLGVLVTWTLGGDVGQVDTFLANGAQFEPINLNDNWAGVPEEAATLDIFGDNATFNGQISTQEEVSDPIFDAYAPVTISDLVEAGPLGEDFFHDIPVNNIFARVDNFDSNTAGDWTTGLTPTAGSVNNVGEVAFDGPINVEKDPSNSSQETAQNLDAAFGVAFDPNVANSGTSGHVSVSGEGNGSFDWYSFTVLADGSRVVLDIDEGAGGGAGNDDTELFLYDADGELVSQNDDNGSDAGSSTGLDSQISTILPAGVYYVAVGEFPSSDSAGPFNPGGDVLDAGATYTLNISQGPDTLDPNPQDPYNDDMNPGQPTGPEATEDEVLDNNGQNVIIVGENEEEFLNTETGAIEGGRAQDFLVGGAGNDMLDGGAHNDYLDGGAGNDMLHGSSGGDVLIDDQGNDILIGGSGTDVIFGRRGAGEEMGGGYGNEDFRPKDFMSGGYGNDSNEIGNEDGAHEYGTGDLLIGDDLFVGAYGNDMMSGGYGSESGFGDPQDYMRDIIVAGDGSDVIFGDNADVPEFLVDDIEGLHWQIWSEAAFDPYGFADLMRDNVQFYYGGADLIYGGWGDDVIFGQGGDDFILAGHGDDAVAGGTGNDIMRGNSGYDSLYGGYGNDIMYGDAGDDFMQGNEDDDVMYGGTGYDNMYGGSGEDLMYGGAQSDDMYGGSQDDVMYGGTGYDDMYGESGADIMYGESDSDDMWGGAGNDLMYGGTQGDFMSGGTGNDIMYGGSGNDGVFGDNGDDVMYGQSGDDYMRGGNDDDSMYGGAGNDNMDGDAGEDLMYGGTGSVDTMHGGSEDDVMYGDSGQGGAIGDDDIMYGDAGNDDMFGEGGSDLMYGGTGNDEMSGGFANDVMSGGAGNDFMIGDSWSDGPMGDSTVGGADVMYGGAGNDIMHGQGGDDLMYGGSDGDRMFGGVGNDVMHGGSEEDTMSGNSGNDIMHGESGRDDIYGGAGEDIMYGGTEGDDMYGGTEADVMYGGSGADDMYGGAGEDIMYGGTDGDYMYGGTEADVMYGEAGEDLLHGQAGADVMHGGTAGDRMYGESGADVMYGESGTDNMFGGTGNDNMFGGTQGDYMSGGNDDDVMSGGEGNDIMYGDDLSDGRNGVPFSGGDDVMYGGANSDDMFGQGGNDLMYGGSGRDEMSGGHGNDVMHGGTEDDIMYGSSGNDVMNGDAGNDEMNGDYDNDTMNGGAGNDHMVGGFGKDVMDGGAGNDVMIGDLDGGAPFGNDDVMYGGSGNDIMYGDNLGDGAEGSPFSGGDDVMYGGAGKDEMYGQGGDDVMYGGAGEDEMSGGFGNDVMDGGTEGDFMTGSFGNDTMHGGDGNDAMFGDDYWHDANGPSDDVMYGGAGNDLVVGMQGDDLMYGGADNDDMFGEDGNDTMHGGTGEDYMRGNSDNDLMYGDAGNDDMDGGSGNDVMFGGADADDMEGGTGNDLMHGGSGNDEMFGEDGKDTMHGDEGHDLIVGLDGDDVMYGGAGNDDMFGVADHDVMYGGIGEDFMSGGSGNDTMYGEAGDDIMEGGDNDDVMYGGTGNDDMDGDAGEDLMYGGTGSVDTMHGGSEDDVMFGDSGQFGKIGDDDIMYGDSGNDDMFGEAGNDQMYGGTGNDDMDGNRGADVMFGGTGNDDMSGGNGSDLMFGGEGNDIMSGGKQDDTMTGGAGNDDVDGDKGDDTLRWTMSDNTPGTVDDYDGGANDDTLELYFTEAEFNAPGAEEAIALFANTVEETGSGTLTLGGRTLTATNMEFVAVHVDGDEIPVLIDDTLTTDEDTDVTQVITATPATLGQDFIPDAQTTTFDTPGSVLLTMPLDGGYDVNFDSSSWSQVGDVWTMDLTDGDDEYGSLIFDATDPEAVTVTLDIPQEDYSVWDPMDDGDVATAVFDYSASVEGSESATVTINVNGANDAPVAADDIVITNILEGPIFIPKSALLANDEDIDEGDVLSVEEVTDPSSIFDENFILNLPGDNRVINGSFEDHGSDVNRGHGSWATYDSLPGWMTDTGVANAPIELQFGGTGGIGAQDGRTKMELDSHREGRNNEGDKYTSSISHVYQDVPTSAGEMLTISFWYSPRSTGRSASNEVTVMWDGEEIATLEGNVRGWQQFSFEVEASDTDDVTRLEFQGSSGSSTVGGYIDNVYVGERDFDYTASDDGSLDADHTDDAHVDVQYQTGNQLVGTDENEILISGEGSDTLFGRDGDDTLIGGEGDDTLVGGSGEDEYFFSNVETDGHDTILGFNDADDTIDLDALFDELEIAPADRAELVEIDGGTITIDHADAVDFSITVSGADLGDTGVDYTSEQLALKGIIVSDES